jgi:hypothetical protein
MILDEVKADVEVSGEIKTSGFKIRTTAKAFQILSSNIYTNKIEAVVREISCNAVDAHVAAKNEGPFDVHLPTFIEPFFAVRDYGTGLSEEDVLEIYTTYFSSTKNNSNEYIGALGLGSKSPFAVAESFNVVSFFKGFKSTYNCYKDENGEPQIAVISSSETYEPDGLYVKVQVKPSEIDLYNEAASRVFRWFSKIPNINNQTLIDQVKLFKESIASENEDFIINNEVRENLVLMGNVAYKLSHPSIPNSGIVFKCKIGEVSFDPGRERITNDEKTVKFLSDKYKAVQSCISAEVKNFLNDPSFTVCEKITKVVAWRDVLLYGNLATSHFKSWVSNNACSKTNLILVKKDNYRIKTDKILTPVSDIINFISGENSIKWIKNPDSTKPISDYFAGKVNNYLRSLGGKHVCIIVDDDQIKELGVSNITEIPKKERTYYSKGSRNYHRYYIVNSYKFTNFKSIEEDKVPKEEKIFIEYKNSKPLTNLSWAYISEASFTLSKTIYAIHSSIVKSKDFDTKGWISLEDYLERFKRNNPKKIVYRKSFNSLVKDFIMDFAKVDGVRHKKLLEQFSDLAIDKKYKPEYKLIDHHENSDELEKLYQKIVSIHPIFKLAAGSDYSTKEVIKFYLTKGK